MSHSLPACILNYYKVPYIEVILIIPLVVAKLFLPILILVNLIFIISAYIVNDTT